MATTEEEVKTLKDFLKQRKGVITRYITTLRRLLCEENSSQVASYAAKVKEAFDLFDAKFLEFIVVCGEDDQTYNGVWFDAVQTRYVEVYTDALKFIKHSKAPKDGKSSDVITGGANANAQSIPSGLDLPRVEIEPFDGDPLKYHAFKRTFDVIVERSCTDPDARLARLISATTGVARDAIMGTQVVGGKDGYDRARNTLADLFGADQLIVQEIVKGLRPEKQLQSSEEVRQFSHRLINARDILTQLKALDEVNSQVVIKSISEALPVFAQNDWSRKQLGSKRDKAKYLKFKDLVDFVQNIAADMSDPLCSHLFSNKDSSGKGSNTKSFLADVVSEPASNGTQGRRRATVLHSPASSSASAQSCVLCGQRHGLWRCNDFKCMNLSERSALIQLHNLCANCLKGGHAVSGCLSGNRCLVCKGMHSVFLHSDTSNAAISHGSAFMPVVRVLVDGKRWVHAALDTCSSATFCSQELADALGLKGTSVPCHVKTLSGSSVLPNSRLVSFTIANSSECLSLSGVKVVGDIPISGGQIDVSDYPHLQGIDLSANLNCTRVDLLIGQDYAEALIPLAVRKGRNNEPFAVQYKFGWTLNGRVTAHQTSSMVISHFVSSCSPADNLSGQDAFPAHERCEHSVNDKRVLELWDTHCERFEGHYVLPIPWMNRDEFMPCNFYVAEKRLDALLKRVKAEGLVDRYDSEIKKMIAEGYIEEIDPESTVGDRVWYLPHHHVINPKKPTKLRVVFDCASRYKGCSLNERVHQGPDLVNGLLGVILRFRLYRYAIQADIKGMYNQVIVPEGDRDALRLLWKVGGKIVHFRMRVHLFGGVWCSSVATYALRRIIHDHPDAHPLLVSAVLRSMYVDDCLISVNTREEASLIVDGLPELLRTGGFVLTKFVVNDAEILEEVPRTHAEVHEFTPEVVGRALGVRWNVFSDSFGYEVNVTSAKRLISRRSILGFVNSVYDPLGLSSPWIIPGRLLLQAATRKGLGWDEEVPEEIQVKWAEWIDRLKILCDIQFPRCLITGPFFDGYHEFHVFSDASQLAYGACVYLRCINSLGKVSINLVAAKAHVAPLKQQTIPRLELQAATTAAKLAATVREHLGISNSLTHYWCDSQIVLAYISSETRRCKTFVANRVGTIRSLTAPSEWRYISSEENPADVLTKSRAVDVKHWKEGPPWLRENYPFWRSRESYSNRAVGDSDPEVVKVALATGNDLAANWIDRMAERYSSWLCFSRGVAWVMKFCCFLKQRRKMDSVARLSAGDISAAQGAIILHAQRCGFPEESRGVFKKSSRIRKLTPFKDDLGVLRVGGRTGHHPIIVPHAHQVSRLLLRYYHERSHSGVEWTLSRVREKFWVTNGRAELKKIRASCFVCKKLFGEPAKQIMADLPGERITPNLPPFTNVGVDVFGPIQVSVGRSTAKRYGCLFTCFVTRAIHIEVVGSLEGDAFLNAFRRFVARRGSPRKVYSDNGTNFVAGERELRKEFMRHARNTLTTYGAGHEIEWVFIPPHAPHMGGVWERMVGIVKRVLRGVTKGAVRLTDEILGTLLCEVEAIVNGRPLTKLSEDPADLSVLTPSHLLLLRAPSSLPPCVPSDNAYRHRWKYVQHLASEFWKRFVREYLPDLNQRRKWGDKERNFAVGDLVLVQQPGLPRGLWPLAIVEEVEISGDGAVRSVVVRSRVSKFRRPITKLVPLECTWGGTVSSTDTRI